MVVNRMRLFIAGMVAFLIGVPLTERVFAADGWDITWSALDLGFAIADASSGAS